VTAANTAVLDASVFVRSVVEPRGEGAKWVAAVDQGMVQGHTATLAFTEVANALLGYVRADALSLADATTALRALAGLPLRLHGPELAPAALGAAIDLGLSAYDGTYAALAESLDGPLVTADRRLAGAVPWAELLS
jgi:predicted nucleic acid-binding protein